jgi:membrane-associated tyrosine/threonine-specific cdc2-inhibitory kinase
MMRELNKASTFRYSDTNTPSNGAHIRKKRAHGPPSLKVPLDENVNQPSPRVLHAAVTPQGGSFKCNQTPLTDNSSLANEMFFRTGSPLGCLPFRIDSPRNCVGLNSTFSSKHAPTSVASIASSSITNSASSNENALPSPMFSITPRFDRSKGGRGSFTFVKRSGAAFDTPEQDQSPLSTPTKRNIFGSRDSSGNLFDQPTSLFGMAPPSTLHHRPTPVCPPTPARDPSWLHEGPAELVRMSSLCSTKVLLTLPWGSHSVDEHEFQFINEFDILGTLGQGDSYEVFHVKDKYHGREYAVKRSRRIFNSKNDRTRYLEEVRAYQKLGPSCRQIVQYYRAWQEEGYFYLQTEYCQRGNLLEFVKSIDCPIPESTIWSWCLEICIALNHLHQHNLVHLDIKLENIFLTNQGELKVGDLGMVRESNHNEDVGEGDVRYMAFELLNNSQKKPSADIFSLGMLLFEVSSGIDAPKEGALWHQLREDKIPKIPTRSDELNKLIALMLSSDPEQRPTALELLHHPLIEKSSQVVDDFIINTPVKSCPRYLSSISAIEARSSDDMDLVYSRGKSSSVDFLRDNLDMIHGDDSLMHH